MHAWNEQKFTFEQFQSFWGIFLDVFARSFVRFESVCAWLNTWDWLLPLLCMYVCVCLSSYTVQCSFNKMLAHRSISHNRNFKSQTFFPRLLSADQPNSSSLKILLYCRQKNCWSFNIIQSCFGFLGHVTDWTWLRHEWWFYTEL